jgi:OmpA-OmpF porin, OOP family
VLKPRPWGQSRAALALAWMALAWPLGACSGTPQGDATGCSDPADLVRFEGARILACETDNSEDVILPLAAWNDDPEVSFWDGSVRLNGRRTRILYAVPPGRSSQEVMRTYRKRLDDQGYEILFECSGFNTCGTGVDAFYSDEAYGQRLDAPAAAGAFAPDTVREPRALVAKAPAGDGGAYLFVFAAYQDNSASPDAGKRVAVFVEQVVGKGTEQHLIVLQASELGQGLDLDGHVPIYGIAFDPDQAEIKPDSVGQLEQVARLMRTRPNLSLYIVGHTDNQGGLPHNLDLSRRRAEAVVTALVRDFGIAATRLSPHGLASLAPVAPNTAEEGRAMNRRIELVAW